MLIPKSLSEIKYFQLAAIGNLNAEELTQTELRLSEIAILCDSTLEYLYSLNLNDLNKVLSEIDWFYKLNMEDINEVLEFNYNGITYQFIKEMNELTGGQWVDLTNYIDQHQENIWLQNKYILALCSRIKGVEHSYPKTMNELEERLMMIEDLTLDITHGYRQYFIKKKIKWNHLSQMYSQLNSQNQNTHNSLQDTINSMDGMGFYWIWLGEILYSIIYLIGWVYMKFYQPLVSIIVKLKLKLNITNILMLKTNKQLNK